MIYIYNYIYTYSFILEVSGDLLTRNRADPPTIFDDPRDVIYDALYNTIYILDWNWSISTVIHIL